MQWSRIAFASMLILALAPAVSIAPMNVSGQSYSTFTTETSITEIYTYSTATRYETATTSVYIGTFGPTSFELNVCGLGANVRIKFNATAGQRYHVEWSNQYTAQLTRSNIPLNFYITTESAGIGDPGCNGSGTGPSFPSSTVLFSEKAPMGSVDWVAPRAGLFIAWLFNFNLEPVKGTWSIVSTNP